MHAPPKPRWQTEVNMPPAGQPHKTLRKEMHHAIVKKQRVARTIVAALPSQSHALPFLMHEGGRLSGSVTTTLA